MTTDGRSFEQASATSTGAATGPGDIDVPIPPAYSPEAPAPKGRRRRAGLLLFVLFLLGVLVLFAGWYLVTRKPITQLPLPGVGEVNLPKYSFSLYGVTSPIGVAASADGSRIYVTESGDQRLTHVYDSKGNQIATFSPPESEPGSRAPAYVTLDPTNGDVYVSDRVAGTIYIYDKDGAFQRKFEPKSAMPNWQPMGLAFDAQGNLYVSDVAGPIQQVEVFGRDGTLLRTIGEKGQFLFPNGLAVDAKGDLFVSDGNNGRLLIFDPTGHQVGVIPRGVANGELGMPRGVTLDDSNRLYVADTTGMVVQVYAVDQTTGDPKYVGTVGAEGVGDGQFQFPNGIAVDTRARLYVADTANNRVQVWSY